MTLVCLYDYFPITVHENVTESNNDDSEYREISSNENIIRNKRNAHRDSPRIFGPILEFELD